MIQNKKAFELINNQFQNPFTYLQPKIEDPFILIRKEDDKSTDSAHSNLMMDFSLFLLKLKFTGNIIYRIEKTYIDVVLQNEPSNVEIIVSELEKKKFLVNYVPAIVLRFNLFKRKLFKTAPPKPTNLTDPNANLLVDLAGFLIINVYDKVTLKTFSNKEVIELDKVLKKLAAQFKHVFFEPQSYPKYVKTDDKWSLVFPEKKTFSWKIFKEEEKNEKEGTYQIPDQPSII